MSHNRDLVTHNLNAAYSKLVAVLMKHNNYTKALEFATTSGDPTLPGIVGHNGAVHAMEEHNYAAARKFAQYAPERDTLVRSSWQSEGAHQYQTHRYHNAIRAFEQINDQKHIRQCYEALFFEEQEKLGPDLTTDSIKNYSATIKRMHNYAKKSGNQKLIEHADELHKHL